MKFTLKRILKEELARSKEEIPQYMDVIIQVLNTNFEQLGNGLSNRLTFADNFNCIEVTRRFTDSVELEVNPLADRQGNLRAVGAQVLSASGLIVDSFKWIQKSNGNVGLTVGFASGGPADCKILILLG